MGKRRIEVFFSAVETDRHRTRPSILQLDRFPKIPSTRAPFPADRAEHQTLSVRTERDTHFRLRRRNHAGSDELRLAGDFDRCVLRSKGKGGEGESEEEERFHWGGL